METTRNYSVLLQTGANAYQVKHYAANSQQSLYPLYRPEGIAVEIRETSTESIATLQDLAERMTRQNGLA